MSGKPITTSLGISASDYVPGRGYIESHVYQLADHLEYGGHAPPETDPGFRAFRKENPHHTLARHLVTTQLAANLNPRKEAGRIRADLGNLPIDYLVSDFGYWWLGGRGVDNLWFRPTALTHKAVRRIASNVRALEDLLNLPVYAENPFILQPSGDLDMACFMTELAQEGVRLCFDVGHFVAWYHNARRPLARALEHLPYNAISLAHVAGLSRVEYRGRTFLLDNHNVSPNGEVLHVVSRLLKFAGRLRWIVYEAEMAPTLVQLTGLRALRSLIR